MIFERVLQIFIENVFSIIMIIILIINYIFILNYSRDTNARKKLFSAIIGILKESSEEKIFISKASLIYEKFIQKNSFAKKDYTSLQDSLENIIYYSETNDKKLLKKSFGIILTDEEKEKLYSFYIVLKEEFPYDILEKYDRELIKNLSNCIEKTDIQMWNNAKNQIIKEIYTKNKKINEQGKHNIISYIFSTVSIIIAIFFGIQTLLK